MPSDDPIQLVFLLAGAIGIVRIYRRYLRWIARKARNSEWRAWLQVAPAVVLFGLPLAALANGNTRPGYFLLIFVGLFTAFYVTAVVVISALIAGLENLDHSFQAYKAKLAAERERRALPELKPLRPWTRRFRFYVRRGLREWPELLTYAS